MQSRSIKAGLAPGTITFIGEQKMESVCIDRIDYNENTLREMHDIPVQQCADALTASVVTWINISGIHNIKLIEDLGACLALHPLTLEDIVNTAQRPKAEAFSDYIFAVLKMISFDDTAGRLEIEHVSVIFGDNIVATFQEQDKEGDVFAQVRERLKAGTGRIRSLKADYLAYALMDAVVDHYFLAVERIGDRIEDLDDKILADPAPADIQAVHQLKRDILLLRKAVWPLREEMNALYKSDSPLIHSETKVFLRDLYDHIIQIIDMVETFRDILSGMHDTYLSSVSNRMNEIMKMLTIIATVFIPLTFIAGVYGMNFEHMPELSWRFGYAGVLGVMLAIALGMICYFRKKKWL